MRLRDYATALRRYWLAIILMAAVGVGVGYGWAQLQTPVYQADASGYIKAAAAPEGTIYGPGQTDGLAQAKVATYLDMASWRTVATTAGELVGVSTPPEQLIQRITLVNPTGTAILKITAQGDSPQAASDLASAWVTALATEIDKVEGTGVEGSAPMTILLGESASLPSTPSFPDVRLAMIMGLVVGLGGGIAFSILRAISDRRLRSSDDVEQRLSIPVAGTLPDVGGLADGKRLYRLDQAVQNTKGQRADFAVRESLRMLRTNLQFMNVDNPPRTIVVTSALPGEGKSTVAANLAGALAASGVHVVLIDGDLRRPTVAATLEVNGDIGLTDVLAGRVEITQVLRRVPGMPNLLALPAGTLPPNPSELLGSERMHALLADLAEHATVIVDAPPLLAVTDGAVLTRQADGALIVVSSGRTGYDIVDKAVDVLEKIHGHVLGVVLNRVALSGGSYGGRYAYGYGTPVGDESAPATREPAPGAKKAATPAKGGAPATKVSAPRGRRRPAAAATVVDETAASTEPDDVLESLFSESDNTSSQAAPPSHADRG